jgi:hypothetical protein
MPATHDDVARVRHAIDVVLRSLAGLTRHEEVGRLLDQARRLMAETEHWEDSPPAAERCAQAMRQTLSVHLEALRAVSVLPQER